VKLVSYAEGFGRIEGEGLIPMGPSLIDYLTTGEHRDGTVIDLQRTRLVAPVPDPGKIVCIGLNYRDHASETGQSLPDQPVLFAKFANSLIGHGEDIVLPPLTSQADYEAELAVVMGAEARNVSESEALNYVAGYMCANDVSARDLQFKTGQWIWGKAIDTFLPTGPCLVTADEIADPQTLPIRCVINGEVLQDSNTSEMVFGVGELISFISQTMTLRPGDMIVTGTPAGVGFVRSPPRFLRDGDEVSIEIANIGRLTNRVRV
jgi:2-keto-4-pentenoate hydratase/2-oxohepta-3-ene-1,7-dioic acid hydratase in catechol pathway